MEAPEEDSLLDKSHIIRMIRMLLPKNVREKTPESMDEDKTSNFGDENESPIETNEIESGCFLWDLSVLPEQATFLHSNHLVPILINILLNPQLHTDRLLEISVGILGNLGAVDEILGSMSEDPQLFVALENLLHASEDPMTLSEITRLLNVGICSQNEIVIVKWMELVTKDEIIEKMLFLVENTLNETLLERTCSFLLNLLTIEETSAEKCFKKNIIHILNEHLDNTSLNPSPALRSEKILELLLSILLLYSSHTILIHSIKNGEHRELIELLMKRLAYIIRTHDSTSIISSCTNIISNIGITESSYLLNLLAQDPKVKDVWMSIEDESIEEAINQISRIENSKSK